MFWKSKFDFDRFKKKLEGPRDPFDNLQDQYPKGKQLYKQRILSMLADAIARKNEKDASTAHVLAWLDGLDLDYADALKALLRSEWHYLHEDVAVDMMVLAHETFTEDLYHAALHHKEDEADAELQPFLRKCVRALRAIGTDESEAYVMRLASTGNSNVKNVLSDFDKGEVHS